MEMFASILKRFSVLALGAVLMASCFKEEGSGPDTKNDGETFLLELPGQIAVDTRGVTGNADENRISSLYLLVFKSDNTLNEVIDVASTLAQATTDAAYVNGNVWKFSATVKGGHTDLMLLANVSDKISSVSAGMTRTETAQTLFYEKTSVWTVDASNPIPMWGEVAYSPTDKTTTRFRMTRMLARVNVVSMANNFTLTSVEYFNYNTKGYVIPDNYTTATDGSESIVKVTAPTVWNDNTSMGKQETQSLGYSGSSYISSNTCSEKIYVFEAEGGAEFALSGTAYENWKANPCLVIGGRYGSSSQTTYYRVDFIEKNADGTDKSYYDLLRNHTYNITITEVSGDGYRTNNDALVSAPMNMNSDTYVYNESGKEMIAVDGPYYISIDKSWVEYNWWDNATFNLEIKTNYPHGWTATPQNVTDQPWVRVNNSTNRYSRANTVTTLPLTPWGCKNHAGQNDPTLNPKNWEIIDGEIRELGYVAVTAGRMSLTIEVRRKPIANLFAHSNVVLKGGRLGFATTKAENSTYPANSQGMHFQWGSLLGIGSDGGVHTVFNASTQIGFNPSSVTPTSYETIPYIDNPSYIGHNDTDADHFMMEYPGIGYNVSAGKGDICRYIVDRGLVRGKWRTPTAHEFHALLSETTISQGVYPNSIGIFYPQNFTGSVIVGGSRPDFGCYPIPYGSLIGAGAVFASGNTNSANMTSTTFDQTQFWPFGGYRSPAVMYQYNNPQIVALGSAAEFWPSTAYSSNTGTSVTIMQAGGNASNGITRQLASAIRCIRDYKNE